MHTERTSRPRASLGKIEKHTYIHACVNKYFNTYIHTTQQGPEHTYMYTYIHTSYATRPKTSMKNIENIHTYIHVYRAARPELLWKNTYIYINVYIHTCIHTYMYTYIHTYRAARPGTPREEIRV
jgi:hypothetical protein